MATVAEQMVKTLVEAGVKRIYGIVGDSLNGIIDAIRREGSIQWIHVRHEEVAAFAAGADAHVTGELAVCAGSCGPGNLHLINGLYDCHRNGVPVFAIAAQIPTAELGSGYFQETHPEALFKDCSYSCQLVSTSAQMPRALETALPQAIGAQAAFPGRQVISMSGDGGFTMLMGDFLTLVQMELPVKVVVFHNSKLGFVDLEQKVSGFLPAAVDLKNPDFAKMATSIGILGVRVEDPADLKEGVSKVISHDGPALLDVVTNLLELSMPPKIQLDQAYGFGLWMMKAVLSGRGSEVIEVAKTNMFR